MAMQEKYAANATTEAADASDATAKNASAGSMFIVALRALSWIFAVFECCFISPLHSFVNCESFLF